MNEQLTGKDGGGTKGVVIVTLLQYSRRPNSSWPLCDDQAAELALLLKRCPASHIAVAGRLGVPGFAIHESGHVQDSVRCSLLVCGPAIDAMGTGTNYKDDQQEIERFLTRTAPEGTATDRIEQATEQDFQFRNVQCHVSEDARTNLDVSPRWEPGRWNNDHETLLKNDCYNYANDLVHTDPRSTPFAVPYGENNRPLSTEEWIGFAVQDGLELCHEGEIKTYGFDRARHSMKPDQWFVALFVDVENGDTHWYRLDNTGLWSHKPGAHRARRCDESGRAIEDPRDADAGPYTFAAFFKSGPRVRFEPNAS